MYFQTHTKRLIFHLCMTHRGHVTWITTSKQTGREVWQFRVNAATSLSNPVFSVALPLVINSPSFSFFSFSRPSGSGSEVEVFLVCRDTAAVFPLSAAEHLLSLGFRSSLLLFVSADGAQGLVASLLLRPQQRRLSVHVSR